MVESARKHDLFVFTYYPTGDTQQGKWELALHRTEIEDIGHGRMTEIAMYCCTSPTCRRKFREVTDHCFECDYSPDPAFAHLPFADALERLAEVGVQGLSATSTKQDVLSVLGEPHEAGGGLKHSALGYIRPWITYRLPSTQLRFEIGKRGLVLTVTFLPKDWEPAKP